MLNQLSFATGANRLLPLDLGSPPQWSDPCIIPASCAASGRPCRQSANHPENALTPSGLTPDVCADGYEAAELAGAQSCDLVIVDVQMARMDGLEAAHRIRALQRTEEAARIIAFTANTTEEMRDACKAALPPGSR